MPAKKITKKELNQLLKSKSEKVLKAILKAEDEEESTALDTFYVLNFSSGDITLEALLGDKGQSFDLIITLDSTVLANHIKDSFPETVIGQNDNLNGKILRIAASVADLSKETNLTSLTVTLKGGKVNRKFPLHKVVKAEGELVDYACRIEFFIP